MYLEKSGSPPKNYVVLKSQLQPNYWHDVCYTQKIDIL